MIKNIRVYDNEAYLVNDLRPEISASLNPDETRALMHVNDYEGLSYIVVNDDNVIVIEDISGDVIEQCSVDEFIDEALAYIREDMTTPRPTDLSKAKRIDLSSGVYACAWGLTDFYPDCLEKLKDALASGEDFQTEWFDCKKELRSGRYTRENGETTIEVTVSMGDLWESEDLIYDALRSACKMETELPDKIIDSIREEASLIEIDDHTYLSSWLPEDATLDQILEETEALEGRCEMANEAMFDELCKLVKEHVDFYNLKEED